MTNNKPGVVKLSGKDYRMVVARVAEFRTSKAYADWGVHNEVTFRQVSESGELLAVEITCTITDTEGRQRGVGRAFDAKNHSPKHAKSFVELCETSAYGRALASIGLAGSDEYASAEELLHALEPAVEEPKPHNPPPLAVVQDRDDDEVRKKALNEQWNRLNELQKTVKKPTWLKHWKTFEASLSDAEQVRFKPYFNEWIKRFETEGSKDAQSQ